MNMAFTVNHTGIGDAVIRLVGNGQQNGAGRMACIGHNCGLPFRLRVGLVGHVGWRVHAGEIISVSGRGSVKDDRL